jgi:hypothetical protein
MREPYRHLDLISYSAHLTQSFKNTTGKDLLVAESPELLAAKLYHAPFALVSHDAQPDPVFCYANKTAQELWAMDWDRFVTLPSRLSAQPDAQEERQRLLALAQRQGFVDNYAGVRITADGRRFRIKDCILWNVGDSNGERVGQAAVFDQWQFL